MPNALHVALLIVLIWCIVNIFRTMRNFPN